METDSGKVTTLKEPSVPENFVQGVIAALKRADVKDWTEFRHGTTVGTNAIIERTGARTGLITTLGFRDVLLAARANKPDLYDSDWDPPSTLVPRELIKTVPQRMDYAGREVEPLDEAAVKAAAEELLEAGVEAVAICFLNAFMNSDHEERAAAIVKQVAPDLFVCTSSEVLPEIREFERTSTTVANAYLGPKISTYLKEIDRGAKSGEAGIEPLRGEMLISHSGGGLMTVASAGELPARICQSGPAAGVMGAQVVARNLGYENSISLDMGGTSADIAAIIDGSPAVRNEWHIEFNIPIIFPAVDLVTIGAGGGTIAWIDAAGTLHSGPQSAGASPGPVAYGRGGTEPTNTDANAVLGRLDPNNFLGGRMSLDVEAAERAIHDRIDTRLGMSTDEAASGMLRLSNAAMINAVRLMTTQRGYDPRTFALIAFGGAGALHAVDLAREIGIKRVIVPRLPGLMSARGILHIDVRHDLLEPIFQRSSSLDPAVIERALERSLAACEEIMARDSTVSEWQIEHSADIRYFGQISGYLTKTVPGEDVVAGIRTLIDEFGAAHEEEFGYRLPPELAEIEVVNLRTTLFGITDETRVPAHEAAPGDPKIGSAQVLFFGEGRVETPYIDRDRLAPGETLEGPAIINEWDSTTVVPPRSNVTVESSGDLLIELQGE